MNRKDFGKLIGALRLEHEDEEGRPWNQQKLAAEANLALGAELFNKDIISSIERGRRSLDEKTLLALADAFQLTSGERKEFFMAASGVDSERIPRAERKPEDALGQLLDRMKQACVPAYIIDSYHNMVAVSTGVIEVLALESVGLGLGSQVGRQFPHNLLRFAFSDEGAEALARVMGESFPDHLFHAILHFRTTSLRYRSTEHFQALLTELRKSRLFRRYWREVYYEEKDNVIDHRLFHIEPPKWGVLSYFYGYLTALTKVGELRLCMMVPANEHTTKIFYDMNQQGYFKTIFLLGAWPDKDPANASQIRPLDSV